MQKLAQPGFWMAGVLVLVDLGLQSILATPFALVDLVLKEGFHQPELKLTHHPLIIGSINLVAIGGAVALGLFLNRLTFRKAFPFIPFTAGQMAAMVVLILGADIELSEADNVLRVVLPPPEWVVAWMHESFFREDRLLSTAFLLVMVAPVTEELLFRGIILRGLLNRFRPWSAILLTSILFAINHVNPWQFISALFLGLLLGWFYVRTGSIAFCILAHAVTNGLSLVASALPWTIPGVNGDYLKVVEFQPWWLDTAGLALVLTGIWAFCKVTPPPREEEVPAPPVIGTLDA